MKSNNKKEGFAIDILKDPVKTIVISPKPGYEDNWLHLSEFIIVDSKGKPLDSTNYTISSNTTPPFSNNDTGYDKLIDKNNTTIFHSGQVNCTLTITLNTQDLIKGIMISQRQDCCWNRLKGYTLTTKNSDGKIITTTDLEKLKSLYLEKNLLVGPNEQKPYSDMLIFIYHDAPETKNNITLNRNATIAKIVIEPKPNIYQPILLLTRIILKDPYGNNITYTASTNNGVPTTNTDVFSLNALSNTDIPSSNYMINWAGLLKNIGFQSNPSPILTLTNFSSVNINEIIVKNISMMSTYLKDFVMKLKDANNIDLLVIDFEKYDSLYTDYYSAIFKLPTPIIPTPTPIIPTPTLMMQNPLLIIPTPSPVSPNEPIAYVKPTNVNNETRVLSTGSTITCNGSACKNSL